MTSEQSAVWSKKRQIIYSPYEQYCNYKAADLALAGEKFLIILPNEHLIIKYKMFFDKYVPNKKATVEEGKDEMIEEQKRYGIFMVV